MKLISWNVNGIRSVWEKGFIDFVKKEDPDVICLQEIKIDHEYTNLTNNTNLKNYYKYWNFAEKKGYSGTATFTKIKPKKVIKGFGNFTPSEVEGWKFDQEGRVLTLEFDNFFIVNAYFPHSRRELARLDYKIEFNKAFLEYIQKLHQGCHSERVPVGRVEESLNRDSSTPSSILGAGSGSSRNDNPNKLMKPIPKKLIVAGDLNVAHREIDLANPKQNQKNAGFTPEERSWMDKFLELGYIDTFREFTKDGGHYTWWTWRANARKRNIGWRIDYFLISENLRPKLKSSKILPNVFGSDHCPVKLSIEI